MKYLILLFFVGCSMRPVSEKSVRYRKSWSQKKRECHSHYLDRFGFDSKTAISICKEELHRVK